MKKALLFALAALCVSAAQAVTMTWSTGKNEYYDGKAITPSTGSTTCQSASFSAQITFSSNITDNTSANLKLLTFELGDNTNWYDTYLWCAGKTAGTQDLNYYKDPNQWYPAPGIWVTDEADRSFLFTVTVERLNDTEAQVKGYINKTLGLNLTLTNVTEFNAWVWGNVSDYATVENTAAYSGVLSESEIEWMATNNTAVLPEPTALALLALGVAGLALKRKVA